MPDSAFPTDTSDATRATQDAIASTLDETTTNPAWQQYRQLQRVYDAADNINGAAEWAEHMRQQSQETDFEQAARNVADMAGNLRDGIDALGWLAETPGLPQLRHILDQISDWIHNRWENLKDFAEDLSDNLHGAWGGDGSDFGSPSTDGAPWGDDSGFKVPRRDPLVLDLDGDGIELTNVVGSNAYVDLDNDGFAERVGWVGGGDGLLVRDLNGNGRIDGIGEMFGNDEQNGFDMLAEFDLNHDGMIDQNDAVFGSLRVWIDGNGNGTTEAGELISLQQANVRSITLAHTASGAQVNGNLIGYTGHFTRLTGETGAVGAAYFSVNELHSRYIVGDDFQYSALSVRLPEMSGYGSVKDLRVAMTERPELADQMKALVMAVGDMSYPELRASIIDFIVAWSGIGPVIAGSRGQFVDASHVALLEAFYGTGFQMPLLGGGSSPNPVDAGSGRDLEAVFDGLIDFYAAMFLSQAAYANAAVNPDHHASLSNPLWAFASDDYDGSLGTAMADFDDVVERIVEDYIGAGIGDGIDAVRDILPWLRISERFRFQGNNVEFLAAVESGFSRRIHDAASQEILLALVEGTNVVDFSNGDLVSDLTSGADLIQLTGSPATVSGGQGDDIYVYHYDDGVITINDYGTYSPRDAIVFEGMFSSRVNFARGSNLDDLIISFSDSAQDRITISGQFNSLGWSQIERLVFADGTEYSADQIRLILIAASQTSADDIVRGFYTSDRLEGGLGSDLLIGGAGNDVYVYNLGDGNDVIRDGGVASNDEVFFDGITSTSVRFSRASDDNDDLLATLSDGAVVRFDEQFYSTGWDRIETFRFGDATLTWQQVQVALLDHAGTSGNDTVVGFVSDDAIRGRAGNDTLIGGAGNDTYFYSLGDGNDIVRDGGIASIDRFIFEGVSSTSVRFSRATDDVDDLLVMLGNGAVVRFDEQFYSTGWDRVENFQFGDLALTWQQVQTALVDQAGTSGNDTIIGFDSNDTIRGRAGNDLMLGGAGNDIYLYSVGDGNDTVRDGGIASTDRFIFEGISSTSVVFSRAANDVDDLLVTLGNGAVVRFDEQFDSLGWDRIENFQFGNTILTWQQIQVTLIDQAGTSGDDTIIGFAGNDTIRGRAGSDRLFGGAGNDFYVYSFGDGNDVIRDGGIASTDRFILDGISLDSVQFSRASDDANDLLMTFGDGAVVRIDQQFDSLGWDRIESFQFSDALLSYNDILGMV